MWRLGSAVRVVFCIGRGDIWRVSLGVCVVFEGGDLGYWVTWVVETSF